MITGADVKSGYGQKRQKPYNSILPYLRAKEAEKAENVKPARKPVHKKPIDEVQEPATTLSAYDEARREILEEE